MIKERIYSQLSIDGSLQQKTIKSGFWSLSSRMSTRGLNLIKLVIVARLLSPNDFGLLGIAVLTMAIFEVFTQTGFKESIIQNKDDIKHYLNTAWTTLIVRGIFLYIIVFISAPFISTFFSEPRAELIIQVMGLTLILEGLQNIATVLLRKELEFQKQFILDLGRALPSFLVTVSLAFILKNVWALIYGSLIGGVGLLIISYVVLPYRPHLEFKNEKAKEMFVFGKWILASTIVIFIATQGDDIFLGKVLGVTALGLYTLAFQISNTPATEITHVISQVTFPAYSKLQEDRKKLSIALSKTIRMILTITIPISIAIIIFTPEFVRFILGRQWLQIIWPVRILVISGLIRSVDAAWGPIYLAKGKPKYDFYKNLIRIIGTFSVIYPLTILLGIIGTSIAVLVGQIFAFISGGFLLKKIIQTKFKTKQTLSYLKGILLSLLISSVIYISIKSYINSIFSFILISIFVVVLFIGGILITEKMNFNPALKELRIALKIIK